MDTITKKYTFNKKERLCKEVEISKLFNEGSGFTIYPLRFIYLIDNFDSSNNPPIRLLISVPKKMQRKAVNRNLIKRRLREAYRLFKPTLYSEEIFKNSKIDLGIIYNSDDILTYRQIEKKLILGLKKLTTEITKRQNFY